jgi:hypothetical protein
MRKRRISSSSESVSPCAWRTSAGDGGGAVQRWNCRPLDGEHPGLVPDQDGVHALGRGELRHLVREVGVGVHR